MKNENQLIASQYKIQALFCDGFKLDIIITKGLQGYIWKSNDCSGYGYSVQECIDMALYMQSQKLKSFVEEKNSGKQFKQHIIHTNLFKELSIEESIENVISSLELKVKDFLSYYHAKNTDLAWKQNDNLTLEEISSAILENRCKIIGLKIANKIIKKQEEEYTEYINVEDISFVEE